MNVFTEMTKCLSFGSYRVFRSNSGGKNFLYLLTLSVIGYILTVVIGLCVPLMNNGGFDGLAEEIPAFEMSADGILTVDYELDTTSSSNQRMVIDTDYNYSFDEDTNTIFRNNNGVREDMLDAYGYRQVVVISRNALVAQNEGEVTVMQYSEIPAEYLEKINVPSLIELLKKLFVIFLIAAFVFYIVRLAVWNIVNAAIGACISSSMGVKNTFGQLYSMSLRAYTLPYLVSCLLVLLKIHVPFKLVLVLLATGFILSRGIKAIKAQMQAEEAQNISIDSDSAFRAMYGDNNPFVFTEDNDLNSGSGTGTDSTPEDKNI